MSESDQLPDLWTEAKIGDVAVVNPLGSTVTADDEQLVTFLPMAAIAELTGRVDMSMQRPFGEVKKGFTRFRDGDVLFAKITPCMENGKSAVVRGLAGGIGCGSTEFHVMRPAEGVSPDYLRHFVSRSVFRQEAKRNMQGAVGQQRVPVDFIREAELPLAPAAEQERIVSIIEELFSRIDEGERALERVQTLVERYRQSVLKAAVTGELTRAWREQRKGKLESGEALLARILKARRAAWEKAELEKMRDKGIKPANDEWKRKYVEPGDIATDYLGDLPESWQRVRIDAVGEVQLGRQRSPEHHDGKHMRPYLRVANVYEERIDTNDIMRMNFTPDEFVTYSLRNGDILLNEGQSKELVGRPAMYKDDLPGACFTNTLVRFRSTSAILPEFAMIVFLYQMKSGGFRKIAKITTNIAHLGAGRFAEMSFPVPSLEEQQCIVDLVDRQGGAFSALVGALVARHRHSDVLRQSVLKAAFSGILATQDPSDESANDLLERIAAERQSAAKPARSRKAVRKVR